MERRELYEQLSAVDFCCMDLRLYLDTHPTDKRALEELKMKSQEAKKLHEEYVRAYGPLSYTDAASDDYFDWINSPWTWERG